nr:putative major capsid protein [uncultured Gammaproteobacteria bacterium]
MANTISKAFVEQFKSNVVHLAQQRASRLRGAVRSETVTGNKHNFERIGSMDTVEKTTRHTDTPVLDVPHSRRVVTMRDWQWADLIDQEDKIRMLISPQSEYAKTGAYAIGRRWDKLIIDAALAAATDGDGNSVAFPSGNQIAHASGGLTVAKILSAKEKLLANDVDEENDPMYFVLGSGELMDLLNTTEVKSSDYNTVKALAKGELSDFAGFSFVRSEQLAVDTTSTNYRKCLAFVSSGIGLAIGADVKTKIEDRADKSYATQVYLAFSAAATRIEEEKVMEVQATY